MRIQNFQINTCTLHTLVPRNGDHKSQVTSGDAPEDPTKSTAYRVHVRSYVLIRVLDDVAVQQTSHSGTGSRDKKQRIEKSSCIASVHLNYRCSFVVNGLLE